MNTTKIQWTDSTVNFWTGCKKVSQGCKYCYMYRDADRIGMDPNVVVRTANGTFYKALSWKNPRLIFTCSWSDFFIEEADQWRDDAWEVIRKTPQHTWQILTKRPERIMDCLPSDWKNGYENVWLGTSVENNETVGRINQLISVSSKIRFISMEPLIGPINNLSLDGINWVIVGGESGNEEGKFLYRPCQLDWIEDIVKQSQESNVSVFVKQLGSYLSKNMGLKDSKGGDINEFPVNVRIREYPL